MAGRYSREFISNVRFTSVAHINSIRFDLARMVPPIVRRPLWAIHFAGVCEILGAVGLLLPRSRICATAALILFLIAVLPANIRAAKANIGLPCPRQRVDDAILCACAFRHADRNSILLRMVPVFAESNTNGDARQRYSAADKREPRWNFAEPNKRNYNRNDRDDK